MCYKGFYSDEKSCVTVCTGVTLKVKPTGMLPSVSNTRIYTIRVKLNLCYFKSAIEIGVNFVGAKFHVILCG